MAREQRKRATYADLQRLPEHLVGEILEGELVATPRPASPHAFAIGQVLFDLEGGFGRGTGGPGGWWIVPEPELHLGPDVVVPDLAGWRRERMPQYPSVAAFELPPDWVCEVLSPSTARHDRTAKARIYARERVAYVWHVDPLARTLQVMRLDGPTWSIIAAHADDERVRVDPFQAVEIDLARWWPPIPA
jgi:Uma2 family endonuclease